MLTDDQVDNSLLYVDLLSLLEIKLYKIQNKMWTAGYKQRAGGRWRWQQRTELKMEKSGLLPMYHPMGVTKLKLSSKSVKIIVIIIFLTP